MELCQKRHQLHHYYNIGSKYLHKEYQYQLSHQDSQEH